MIKAIILTILAGTAAGFFNTVAGGGSLITMPILIFLGLPSAVANGTNRIALFIQNIIAVLNFKSKGFFDWKIGLILGIPALFGSIVGSNIAVSLSDKIFNRVLAIVMFIVIALIIWSPQKKISSTKAFEGRKGKIIGMIVFFFIGIYGGFIQAGVGIIIIASMTLLTGFSLAKINSYKVFIVGVYMIASLLVFILNDKVSWAYGLSLAVGNGLGAFIGSNFAVKKGDKWIKGVLVIAVVFMALKLLGVINI